MDQLESSPYQDDLREELAARPGRGASKLTLALAAGVVLVAGVLIGIQAGRLSGQAGAQTTAQQRPLGGGAGQPGYAAQRPDGGRRSGGGGQTTGTVEKVEGGKVYVKTADGSTVAVSTDDQTAVLISKAGKLSDLESGSAVVVRGRAGADGSVTAASITQGGVPR
ncbi:hypothetical protein [Nonomuraea sp. B1E8]|uniref:hypothetical protein n=1 Tax=unclassified Nonomuraea TaxID=2593643 RepID=UPI00325E7108